LNEAPKRDAVVRELISFGAKASATHLDPRSIRTCASRAAVVKVILNIVKRSKAAQKLPKVRVVPVSVNGQRRNVLASVLIVALSLTLLHKLK
jgi:hypothetical protein